MKKPCTLFPALALSLSLFHLPAAAAEICPVVSSQTVLLRDKGFSTSFEVPMYSIDGSNYIKLRDLAVLLDSTGAPFECAWSREREAVELTAGTAYTRIGGEWDALETEPVVQGNSDPVFLDGSPVALSGYKLNQNNFYKLRDLGQALNVAVYWDHALEQVVVSTDASYADAAALEDASRDAGSIEEPVLLEPEDPVPVETEAPVLSEPEDSGTIPQENLPAAIVGTLANGMEITDDNIRGILNGLRDEYPEGRVWNNGTFYSSDGLGFRGVGCAAFAAMCTDAVWGDNPGVRYDSFEQIRVGDILRVKYDSHSVVVLEVLPDSVIVTEGNYEGVVHWDRILTREYLENGNFFGTTRYPA